MADTLANFLTAPALLTLTSAELALARQFVFAKWCERAHERGEATPLDLSHSCKYGTLFMHTVFGGDIAGNYQHQFNIINGSIVDLSDAAADVCALLHPYIHEPELFDIPEHTASMQGCQPRVAAWVAEFLLLDRR
ncbi:MAG: transcriptional regulator [Steroidobacteraceae bacterium]